MSWLRLDDRFTANPKVAALTDREFRVHLRLLCWCSAHGTEGNVPPGAFNEVPGLTRRMARHFLDLGLWDPPEDDTDIPTVHDFLQYRPKDVTGAERQKEWRERHKRNAESVTDSVTDDVTPSRSSRTRAGARVPVPSRPEDSGRPLEVQDAATAFVPPVSLVKDMPA